MFGVTLFMNKAYMEKKVFKKKVKKKINLQHLHTHKTK